MAAGRGSVDGRRFFVFSTFMDEFDVELGMDNTRSCCPEVCGELGHEALTFGVTRTIVAHGEHQRCTLF